MCQAGKFGMIKEFRRTEEMKWFVTAALILFLFDFGVAHKLRSYVNANSKMRETQLPRVQAK